MVFLSYQLKVYKAIFEVVRIIFIFGGNKTAPQRVHPLECCA